MNIYIYTHIHICIYIYTYTYIPIYIHIYVCMHLEPALDAASGAQPALAAVPGLQSLGPAVVAAGLTVAVSTDHGFPTYAWVCSVFPRKALGSV